MELVGHDFYLFIDEESSKPSVVYRRKGWSYGVIALDHDFEEAIRLTLPFCYPTAALQPRARLQGRRQVANGREWCQGDGLPLDHAEDDTRRQHAEPRSPRRDSTVRGRSVTARHLKSAFATMGLAQIDSVAQGGPVTLSALLLTPGSVPSVRRWTASSTPRRGWASSTGLMQPPSSRRRHGCTSNAPAPNGGAMTTVSATRRPARASEICRPRCSRSSPGDRSRRAVWPSSSTTTCPNAIAGTGDGTPARSRSRSKPCSQAASSAAPGETITSNASTP
jgi:hypothetical protein